MLGILCKFTDLIILNMEIYIAINRGDNSAHIVKGKQALSELMGCSWKTTHSLLNNEPKQNPVSRKGWEIYIPTTIKLKARDRGVSGFSNF